MCDLLSEARAAAAERHRNGEGWYCCDCGELIGRLADEIERLRALLAGYEAMETSMKQEAK